MYYARYSKDTVHEKYNDNVSDQPGECWITTIGFNVRTNWRFYSKYIVDDSIRRADNNKP